MAAFVPHNLWTKIASICIVFTQISLIGHGLAIAYYFIAMVIIYGLKGLIGCQVEQREYRKLSVHFLKSMVT